MYLLVAILDFPPDSCINLGINMADNLLHLVTAIPACASAA